MIANQIARLSGLLFKFVKIHNFRKKLSLLELYYTQLVRIFR